MNKKWFIFLFFLLFLTGCLSSKPTPEPTHTLRVALWDYEVTKYDRQLVEAFEAENPDIDVEIISYRSEIYTKSVETLLESGARADIVYANQMAMVTDLWQSGFALPLDTLIKRDNVDLSPYLYVDSLRDENGALMALPYRLDKYVLYYNRDFFDRAGLPYPSADMTWDVFYETASQLQQYIDYVEPNSGKHSVYSIYMPTHWSELLTTAPFSAQSIDYTELEQGLELLVQLQQEGIMNSQRTSRAQRGVQRLFEGGNYGMYICGTWLMHYLVNDTADGSCTMNWSVTNRPHWEGMENIDAAWMTSLCINRESTEIDAAWRFLQFVCGKRGAEIMAQNLMLPAYWDQDVERLLDSHKMRYNITAPLNTDAFDPPQPVATTSENTARSLILDEVGNAILALETPQECIARIQEIQTQYFP